MEHLRTELALVLGEPVSRVECISRQPDASLYTLYDDEGDSLPMVAKYFTLKDAAAQEAQKLSLLAKQGKVRVPLVFGVVSSEQPPLHEVLLLERLGGVSIAVPARTAKREQQLRRQIVSGLLAWHQIDSGGLVGTVDSQQKNGWPAWYRQRIEVLWAMITMRCPAFLCMDDRRILYRSRDRFATLFGDFNDPCVLIHGNLSPDNILKNPGHDRLLAMVNPGPLQWAPREFDLYPFCGFASGDALLNDYYQYAPLAEGFVARRWLYLLWEEIARWQNHGKFNRQRFRLAAESLLPWLS